ncbi:fam-c protein [Plasmodium vinckei]|uniref:Fam-c protein n=1 Tax=Plasmodium vinckei TaxID=5860 RepID=A0A6V7SD43_PLAVN|nr:fam-c protein [Plasmodium vinckei]
MNKRVFSLVCATLYALLVVTTHCSEQKVSDVGNKNVRSAKEINRRNEKNGIESKHKTELNNNRPKDDKEFKNYNISKRDIKTNKSSNKSESLPIVNLIMGNKKYSLPVEDPELLKTLLFLKKKLKKEPLNNTEHLSEDQSMLIKSMYGSFSGYPKLLEI